MMDDIIEYLHNYGPSTRNTIAKELTINNNTLNKILVYLLRTNQIQKVEGRKYEVVKKWISGSRTLLTL